MVTGTRRLWPWSPLVSFALGLFEAGRCPAPPQPELTPGLHRPLVLPPELALERLLL